RDVDGEPKAVLAEVVGVCSPQAGADEAVPQMKLTVADEIAATYGLAASHTSAEIADQYIAEAETLLRDEGKEFDVTLTYPEEEKKSIADLQDMKVDTPVGSSISLEEVAEFKEVLGPVTLTRENQQSQTTVTSELADRDLGSVTTDIEA